MTLPFFLLLAFMTALSLCDLLSLFAYWHEGIEEKLNTLKHPSFCVKRPETREK